MPDQNPQQPSILSKLHLNPGERFIGGTINAQGITTAIILLPGETTGNWKAAMKWAKGQGGELPNRVESALLFAHAKDEFQEDSYWTGEECSSASAWFQHFSLGNQYSSLKGYALRARAVCRLVIE